MGIKSSKVFKVLKLNPVVLTEFKVVMELISLLLSYILDFSLESALQMMLLIR